MWIQLAIQFFNNKCFSSSARWYYYEARTYLSFKWLLHMRLFILVCALSCKDTKSLLSWNKQLLLSPLLLWQLFATWFGVTAMLIHCSNDQCHIKWLESYKICLSSYYSIISFYSLKADARTHTHKHRHCTLTHVVDKSNCNRCMFDFKK